MSGPLRIIVGNGNQPLGHAIAEHLGVELDPDDHITRFADGEVQVEIGNVRHTDLFIIQTTQPPAENLIELLLAIDAAKRSSASRIVAFLPYFGYARQDRKHKPRVPISAKRVSEMIESAGADHVVLVDLHSGQAQGFFEIPVDHVYTRRVLIDRLKDLAGDLVLCGPDANAMKLVRSYAKRLGWSTTYAADKTRTEPDEVAEVEIIGQFQGKDVVLLDDMINTGGTMVAASQALKAGGANSVRAAAVHGLFTRPAPVRLAEAPIDQVIVTNTLPIDDEKRAALGDKLEVIDISAFLAECLTRVHDGRSVSSLLE